MWNALAIWIALCQPANQDAGFLNLFQEMEFECTKGGYAGKVFSYRLFVPEGASEDQRFPLIVWLHGGGAGGEDNLGQLKWLDRLIFTGAKERSRFPFFLLAVQCPADNMRWSRGRQQAPDDMANVANAILKETLRTQSVDPDRVYLMGVSSGGNGCWRFAVKFPQNFAAVVPMGSYGSTDPRLDRIVGIPIWAFHSTGDPSVSVDKVRDCVARLRELGGNVHLTEIDSEVHDSWSAAFHQYYVLDWVLAQRRGGPIYLWWQIALQGGLVIAIVGTGWGAFRYPWWAATLGLLRRIPKAFERKPSRRNRSRG